MTTRKWPHTEGGAERAGRVDDHRPPFGQIDDDVGFLNPAVKSEVPAAQFELAAKSGAIDIDAFLTTEADGTRFEREGDLAEIDYSVFDNKELAGLSLAARKPWVSKALRPGSSCRSIITTLDR